MIGSIDDKITDKSIISFDESDNNSIVFKSDKRHISKPIVMREDKIPKIDINPKL